MAAEISVIGLLMIAVIVAIAVRLVRVPYTVALVLTGLALGAVRPVVPGIEALFAVHLSPEVLFAILLPGLLYEAAFHISLRDLRRNWRVILLLAAPGVALASAVTAGLSWAGLAVFGVSLPLLAALLFGALISATDPISVLALLKELGVSRRLRVVMEGESLVNDGVAVVMFAAIAGLLAIGMHGGDGHESVDAAWVVRLLLWEVGAGLAIGVALGAAQSFVTSRLDEHLIEIAMTTVVAFGSYLLADGLHASGVLAVVAAGVTSGNYGGRHGMSPTTRVAVTSLWEYVTFVANSLVFLLIGLEVDLVRVGGRVHLVLVAWLAVLAARAVAIWGLTPLLGRSREKVSARWKPLLWWGGLHGALSMALALSLPRTFEHRDLILDLTFGTVLLSILVQGLTVKPLLRRLGLGRSAPGLREYELQYGRRQAATAGLRELNRQHEIGRVETRLFERLERELQGRVEAADRALCEIRRTSEERLEEDAARIRRDVLLAGRDALGNALSSGNLSAEAGEALVREVDAELDDLEGTE